MQTGVVAKIMDKGFGFIKIDGGDDNAKDLFFHANSLVDITFDDINEGDKVQFEVTEGEKGPQAINVSLVAA